MAANIARSFFTKYDKDLAVEIKSETGGDYQNALVTWIAGNDATGGLEPSIQYYRKKMEAGQLTAEQQQSYAQLLSTAIDNAKVSSTESCASVI